MSPARDEAESRRLQGETVAEMHAGRPLLVVGSSHMPAANTGYCPARIIRRPAGRRKPVGSPARNHYRGVSPGNGTLLPRRV
jgi:hypothetical protein